MESVVSNTKTRRTVSPHRRKITQILRQKPVPTSVDISKPSRSEDLESPHTPTRLSCDSSIPYTADAGTVNFYNGDMTIESEYRRQYSCPGGTNFTLNTPTTTATSTRGIGAYVLQPDGTMAAIRWDDKSGLEKNQSVLNVLKQEKEAQQYGATTGKIQSTTNSKSARIPAAVLNWLAADATPVSIADSTANTTTRSRTHSTPIAPDIVSGGLQSPPNTLSNGTGGRAGARRYYRNRSLSSATYKTNYSSADDSGISPRSDGSSAYSGSSHASRSRCTKARSMHSTDTAPIEEKLNSLIIQNRAVTLTPGNSRLAPIGQQQPTSSAATPPPKRHSSSSQVEESYWSPEQSPPLRVSTYRQPQLGTRAMQHTSQQQRQQSVENAANLQREEGDQETPVWEYFKFYEHCATSDF